MTEWIIDPKRLAGMGSQIGALRLSAVTGARLNALYASMEEVTTVYRIQRLHRLLGQAFMDAVRKRVFVVNPCDEANPPRFVAPRAPTDETEDERRERASQSLDSAQATAFLDAARAFAEEEERDGANWHFVPERCWSAYWHVALMTGLRPGELFGLKWRDLALDADEPAVHVQRNLIRLRDEKTYRLEDPKTATGKRIVPLEPEVIAELKRWATLQKQQRSWVARGEWLDKDFVFTGADGQPLVSARASFRRISERAELGTWKATPKGRVRAAKGDPEIKERKTGPLPKQRQFTPSFRPYDLRHTFGTLLVANGVSITTVSKLMGHTSPGFTASVYIHVLPVQRREATATLGGALFRRTG